MGEESTWVASVVGTATCPSESSPVMTKPGCNNAITYMTGVNESSGLPAFTKHEAYDRLRTDSPSGCSVFYRNNGGIVVHWNSNNVGDETWDNSWNNKRGVLCKVDATISPPTDPSSGSPTLKPSPEPTCKPKTTKSCSDDADCACFTRCINKPSKCKCLKNKCRVRRWDCATKECVPWYTKTWSTGTYVSKWGVCKKIQE